MVEDRAADFATPYLFNGKELDGETGLYNYGARYYDPSLSLWMSVDPLASKYLGLSPYAYVANNPIAYVDLDGRDHIFYLVFQKGTKGADKIAAQAQALLNNNNINLKVQVMYTGMEGLGDGYRNKLDGTDRLSFIGNREFINSVYGGDISNHQGTHDPLNGEYNNEKSVGFVNQSEINEHASEIGFTGNMDKVYARVTLHEGIGHPDLGLGHPDGQSGVLPDRYKGGSHPNSIMDSGNRMDWSNPDSYKFLPVDLGIINRNIPQRYQEMNINGMNCTICRDGAVPVDNFTNRLD